MPSAPAPRPIDLLPEASLPAEERANRIRYRVLERFDVFLPAQGAYYLSGPDPSKIPHQGDGLYQLLLRVEASSGRVSRSDTGDGIVQAGGVAGFAIPPLRYYVGTGEAGNDIAVMASRKAVRLLAPRTDQMMTGTGPINFRWSGHSDAAAYLLEVRSPDDSVLSALLAGRQTVYAAPPFIREHAGQPLEWRVIALGTKGKPLVRSGWQAFQIEPE